MEGFDEYQVRKVLGIPSRFVVPIIIATGVPNMPFRATPRYPTEEVVYGESFGQPVTK